MGYLQVRDFPEDLHEELRVLARKEQRSVSQQTIIAIREHVAEASARARDISSAQSGIPRKRHDEVDHRARRKKVFERIERTPKPTIELTPEEIVAEIHEGREERDARIRL